MLNKIIKFLTKRKTKQRCSYCKKNFIGYSYNSYHRGLGLMNVVQGYCSKNHEKAMGKAIKKCCHGKKLTKQDKIAIKDLRYVNIKNDN